MGQGKERTISIKVYKRRVNAIATQAGGRDSYRESIRLYQDKVMLKEHPRYVGETGGKGEELKLDHILEYTTTSDSPIVIGILGANIANDDDDSKLKQLHDAMFAKTEISVGSLLQSGGTRSDDLKNAVISVAHTVAAVVNPLSLFGNADAVKTAQEAIQAVWGAIRPNMDGPVAYSVVYAELDGLNEAKADGKQTSEQLTDGASYELFWEVRELDPTSVEAKIQDVIPEA